MKELRLHIMKSHDCHIFMQKLIPIAFREMLPESMWSTLTEVSLLFQIICSMTLDVVKVQELEDKVATILCNLEKIFPPSFFDSIEHLIVHLPYEAHVGGPVQYRWMYPFERFLRGLIMKVKNKAHVEASIVEAYLVEEISIFTFQYFAPQVLCKRNMPSRNDDLAMNDARIQQSIFNFPGRGSGASKKRWLSGSERHIIEMYILTNCEVITPYYERVVDDSRWTEVVFQEDETIPTPQVLTDDHNYALHDPNGIQLVIDLNQQGAGTSRAANGESDNEPDEDSFDEDYETELDNYD
ncbi:UNVERIFIED_CONTAM: hypothetical protein Slati_2709900 [Sesamum latifolium]|uniref:DUF4218 domain-containing protein n=1 Tax=Sesamum latifolium TaxID=2727402 RepID=A0AAW2VZA2_9LAMI